MQCHRSMTDQRHERETQNKGKDQNDRQTRLSGGFGESDCGRVGFCASYSAVIQLAVPKKKGSMTEGGVTQRIWIGCCKVNT